MKVLVLGGAGTYGHLTAQVLASSGLVSEIVIAGRNLAAAEQTAYDLGAKAVAAQVDVLEEGRLSALAAGSDLIINAAGPEFRVVLPALREAIRANVDYCDLCALGSITEQALALDGAAKDAGITAIVGTGFFALTGPMAAHAARQLDAAEDVRVCWFLPAPLFGYEAKETLEEWRALGHADMSWQCIMAQAAGKVRVYRDGDWASADPLEDAIRVRLPHGDEVTADPLSFPEPVSLPRTLTSVSSASAVTSFFPPSIGEVYCGCGRRLAAGELDESQAAFAFFEYLAAHPEEPTPRPKGGESGMLVWAEAIGTKDGRRVCHKCWPVGDWESTQGPLAAVAFKLLRGEIDAKGVLAPEACLDPLPFFAEAAKYGGERPKQDRLIDEYTEVLE
jgi:saccharopine dehydrogenase-like NADP-dependent oxidoreductase